LLALEEEIEGRSAEVLEVEIAGERETCWRIVVDPLVLESYRRDFDNLSTQDYRAITACPAGKLWIRAGAFSR